MIKELWNERYSLEEYIYGAEPNEFFKEQLINLKPGNLLLPGEGEGRNAIYAASKGWQVDAVNFSETAKVKALKLAELNSVKINYFDSDLMEFNYPENKYDLAAIIFVHLSAEKRNYVHKKIISSLKREGLIILEAFNKNQIDNNSGGPKDVNLLYGEEDILKSFDELEKILLESITFNLSEGSLHQGKADLIRFIGRKK